MPEGHKDHSKDHSMTERSPPRLPKAAQLELPRAKVVLPKPPAFRRVPLSTTLTLMRKRMTGNEDGATAIEYALIAAGIGAAVAAAVWSLGSSTHNFYASLAAMF
jgi:pilus assembly protein Flp/PilA